MHEEALAHCTAAMRLLEHTTHHYGQADTWDSLGFIHVRAGNLGLAAHAYERAVELFRSIGARFGEAESSLELGLILTKAGDPARARQFLETALRIFSELRHDRSRAAAEALARLDSP
jgi:Tfp pilus assembly protein PilF